MLFTKVMHNITLVHKKFNGFLFSTQFFVGQAYEKFLEPELSSEKTLVFKKPQIFQINFKPFFQVFLN